MLMTNVQFFLRKHKFQTMTWQNEIRGTNKQNKKILVNHEFEFS